MSRIALGFLLLFFLFACMNEKTANHSLDRSIVKIVELEYSDVSDKGNEILKGSYNSKKVYVYNLQGLVVDYRVYTSKNELTDRITNMYDLSGKLLRQVADYSLNSNSQNNIITYVYDKNGNKTEVEEKQNNGTVTKRTISKYDGQNNLIEEIIISSGSPDQKLIYTWNGKKMVTQDLAYSNGGTFLVSGRNIITYNDNKQVVDTKLYALDSSNELSYYSNTTNKYDDEKNIVETDEFDTENKLVSNYSFKYENLDKSGNWLMKTSYRDRKAYQRVERTIQYEGDEDIESSTPVTTSSSKSENNIKNEDSKTLMLAKDIQLLLLGSGFRKAEVALGNYDDLEADSWAILNALLYKNKVKDVDGKIKNIVLIVRFNRDDKFNWNTAMIDKVFVLPEDGNFYLGATPMTIVEGKLQVR